MEAPWRVCGPGRGPERGCGEGGVGGDPDRDRVPEHTRYVLTI